MELYVSHSNTDHALISVLQTLQMEFNQYNIDEDTQARKHLVELAHGTAVPTLVFEDGTYLINPTPEQFTEKIKSVIAGEATNLPIGAVLRQWVSIALFLLFGGVCFLGGFSLSAYIPANVITALVASAIIAFIGFFILSFVPTVKQLLAALKNQAFFKISQHFVVLAYAGTMGLALGMQQKDFDVALWAGFAGFLLALSTVSAALTRDLWAKWKKQLGRFQFRLSLVSLIGFLLLFALTRFAPQAVVVRVIIGIMLLVLTGMVSIGCMMLVGAKQGQQSVDRVSGALFPAIGLLIVLALL